MKAIVIGSGTIGSAVRKALEEKGHEVVSVGRKSGLSKRAPMSNGRIRSSSRGWARSTWSGLRSPSLPIGDRSHWCRVRINCISPTVLAESVAYHAYFAGFIPVPAWEVGQAYLRAMSTPITGRILKLHKTSC